MSGKAQVYWRQHFGYDVEAASDEATIAAADQGESLTVQSMAEDADINVLMARYGITGKMPETPFVPEYGDYSGITDYRSAMHACMEAAAGFMELPAALRARFGNDPQQLLEFMADRGNLGEAQRLGLCKAEVPNGDRAGGRDARPGASSGDDAGSPGEVRFGDQGAVAGRSGGSQARGAAQPSSGGPAGGGRPEGPS